MICDYEFLHVAFKGAISLYICIFLVLFSKKKIIADPELTINVQF